MILRKPYAFLMKHFKKINFILLLSTIYIFIKTITLLGYTKDYATGNTVVVDAITNFFTAPYFLIHVIIILIASILLYLLIRKDKPIKTYTIVILEYLIFLILSIYLNSYFNDFFINGYDKAFARTINGFVLIFSLPQYLVLLLLFIRFIGLDLKSFGFHKDKEFLTNEEDREEVEVEVGLDKDKLIRKTKMTYRKILYFIKEHKIQLSIIVTILLIPTSIYFYNNIYLTNKIYKTGDMVASNYYEFKVNNTYITTRNYRGDTINKDKSYIIIDLDTTNTLETLRTLDIEKFTLLVDGISYTPTTNYNQEFEDLGNTFKGQSLKGKATSNYFLIFEIKKPTKESNFVLRYQDLVTHSKLIRIRLAIKDISGFITKDTKRLKEEISIQVNKERVQQFMINSYEIGEEFLYTYETCNYNECFIREYLATPPSGKQILFLKVNPNDNINTVIEDIVKYGKVKYTVNGITHEEKVSLNFNKKYRGNYLYINTKENIKNASNIEIVLTIRNNQYVYILK